MNTVSKVCTEDEGTERDRRREREGRARERRDLNRRPRIKRGSQTHLVNGANHATSALLVHILVQAAVVVDILVQTSLCAVASEVGASTLLYDLFDRLRRCRFVAWVDRRDTAPSRLQTLEQACQSRLRRGSGQQRQHGQQESRRFRHDVTKNRDCFQARFVLCIDDIKICKFSNFKY